METWIYKGSRKANTYLYITRENDFSMVPDALLTLLGKTQFIMQITLSADRKLAQADIHEVMQYLESQGYYLQMPPGDQVPEKLC